MTAGRETGGLSADPLQVAHAVQRYLREFYGTGEVPGVLNLAAAIEPVLATRAAQPDAGTALERRLFETIPVDRDGYMHVDQVAAMVREVRAALTPPEDQP